MKVYKAKRKGLINYLIIGCSVLPVIAFFFYKNMFVETPFIFLILLIPLALVLWIYFDTFYKIDNGKLIYRSGFLRGEIAVLTIKEITKGKTMWAGIKPALAPKGLTIKFNRYEEVYIAPENHDEVIADLLVINPEIDISE